MSSGQAAPGGILREVTTNPETLQYVFENEVIGAVGCTNIHCWQIGPSMETQNRSRFSTRFGWAPKLPERVCNAEGCHTMACRACFTLKNNFSKTRKITCNREAHPPNHLQSFCARRRQRCCLGWERGGRGRKGSNEEF